MTRDSLQDPSSASGAGDDAGPDAGASLDLLLVDDDDLNQEFFEILLLAGGHRVTIAGNGKEALEAVREHDFDAVLMDIQMPVMDGIAAMHAIRALPGEKGKVPVIAMSGDVDRLDEAMENPVGFSSLLAKPMENEGLARALARATGRPVSLPGCAIAAPDAPPPSAGAVSAVEAFLDNTDSLKNGLR